MREKRIRKQLWKPVGSARESREGFVVAFVLGMVAMLILLLLLGATITFHFKGKEVTLSKEKIEKQLKEER